MPRIHGQHAFRVRKATVCRAKPSVHRGKEFFGSSGHSGFAKNHAMAFIIVGISPHVSRFFKMTEAANGLDPTNGHWWLSALVMVLIAPLVEEFVMRGGIHQALIRMASGTGGQAGAL